MGSDTIATGNGTDTVLGDNGYVVKDAEGNHLAEIASKSQPSTGAPSVTDLGGDDVITLGNGDKRVLGGDKDDTITLGTGSNIVFGDNGRIVYDVNGVQALMLSTDTTEATTGDDQITAADGNNIVIAGLGSDKVKTGSGNDAVFGDSGVIQFTYGKITRLYSTMTSLGGNDLLNADGGYNIVIGGFNADAMYGSFSNDILTGGNADIMLTVDGKLSGLVTDSPNDPAAEAMQPLVTSKRTSTTASNLFAETDFGFRLFTFSGNNYQTQDFRIPLVSIGNPVFWEYGFSTSHDDSSSAETGQSEGGDAQTQENQAEQGSSSEGENAETQQATPPVEQQPEGTAPNQQPDDKQDKNKIGNKPQAQLEHDLQQISGAVVGLVGAQLAQSPAREPGSKNEAEKNRSRARNGNSRSALIFDDKTGAFLPIDEAGSSGRKSGELLDYGHFLSIENPAVAEPTESAPETRSDVAPADEQPANLVNWSQENAEGKVSSSAKSALDKALNALAHKVQGFRIGIK
jgi:hypothetical protein